MNQIAPITKLHTLEEYERISCENLYACFTIGQMNAVQLQHHIEIDPGFAAYVKSQQEKH